LIQGIDALRLKHKQTCVNESGRRIAKMMVVNWETRLRRSFTLWSERSLFLKKEEERNERLRVEEEERVERLRVEEEVSRPSVESMRSEATIQCRASFVLLIATNFS